MGFRIDYENYQDLDLSVGALDGRVCVVAAKS
jgi:hypothetical protein